MTELTLSIIKPHAVIEQNTGAIIDKIEKAGFEILTIKKIRIPHHISRQFYAEHTGKPFFDTITKDMARSDCVVMILQKHNAINDFRELLGHTDPQKAAPNSIRQLFGRTLDTNAVHGSDSSQSAVREISFFFSLQEYSQE